MLKLFIISFLLSLYSVLYAQKEIPLYESSVPNSKAAANEEEIIAKKGEDTLAYKVYVPTISVFLPPKEKSKGTAVIICPGGGYHVLVMSREGSEIARAFNKIGIAAFVLKYRLPEDRIMQDKSIGPLQDAQRAVQLVREHATQWNINPGKVGIMGFSAGGHLASTAGTHFESALIENKNHTSLRPDFMILVYPVISFSDSLGHSGSRENLIGKNPSEKQILFFSNELHTDRSTPPAFIVLAGDDSVVKPGNSFVFYNELRKNGVIAEMHVYSAGEHGFLRQPPFEEWFGRCCYWLKNNGWLM
jgi:acetyl esterase/lipase